MLLSLVQLRSDYKAVYRSNWKVAQKLEVLIESSKIELSYEGEISQAGKRVKLSTLLKGADITLRTLQRWKDAYRGQGICGLAAKKKGCKISIDLLPHIQQHIEFYRSNYRWGSEVIQAHLLKDKEIFATRYKIERYFTQSGLRLKYPCSTIKKTKGKAKKHTKKVIVHHPGEHTQVDMNYDYSRMMSDGVAYAAVEANQKFLRPLFCGDKISVYWKMVDVTAKSLTIRQAFSKGVETRKSLPADAIIESLVFDATIKLVSVDPKTGRAVDMLKSHFELFNT